MSSTINQTDPTTAARGVKPARASKGGCGCGATHGDCTCHTSTCCGLHCFERPNYFCGHLLTDADLTLEQKYVVEKNKLYHRAIDGHGVVCGLRLTCDETCDGYIHVAEGYAIDACGNDLVV